MRGGAAVRTHGKAKNQTAQCSARLLRPLCRQVFRTEHWSRKLGGAATLPLTAVMLATTALCALCAAAAAHPAEAAALVQWPWAALGEGGLAGLPWQAALWTGILTTDICLLIEVGARKALGHCDY